jgi:predicted lysophospholipase L1 biosynthesis ABC-type transport system permease subunit
MQESFEPEQRLSGDVFTLEGYMDRLIAQRRFTMTLLALFGALGLIIAGVGIYGVMACIVAQRTGEIRVRMALGATRGNVVSMVLKRAGVMTALGLVVPSRTQRPGLGPPGSTGDAGLRTRDSGLGTRDSGLRTQD